MQLVHTIVRGIKDGRGLLATGLLALAAGQPVGAAPSAELWERWTAHDADASTVVDHGVWHQLLGTYLQAHPDGINRFDYANVGDRDRTLLDRYLERLTGLTINRFNRAEQRAYWINFYNALTVKLILDHFPVESILDISISPGFFAFGPWDKKLVMVEGEALSLNDVEHRILRPIWRDPRIHYAVNCASLGCPNLRHQAFTSANTETLLDEGARDYVNHPRGAFFIDGGLHVSSIFHWFRSDFGGSDRSVLEHLVQFADPALRAKLMEITSIDGHDYDWALNRVPTASE